MARRVDHRPRTSAFARLCLLGALPVVALLTSDCYSSDDGTPPPLASLYFPVGLQVSAGGSVLYAVNSDFDLQFNGGTLQSYDLALIRRDVMATLANPPPGCPLAPPVGSTLGEVCAPPVESSTYVRDSAIIGAFATDLLLSKPPAQLVPQTPRLSPNEQLPVGTRHFDRLFAPVRGNASLTWASVERDDPNVVPPQDKNWGPFRIRCGQEPSGRCDAAHSAGENPNELGNTRGITMPGEPFGIAMSEDGESIVVTHQNDPKTSLFSSGLARLQNDDLGGADIAPPPALQFVLENVPLGGVGIAAIPHDRDAFTDPATFPRPAFLETSRASAQMTLIRHYPDEFAGVGSALRRPFLDVEGFYPVAIGASNTDSRGIAIDPTPRLACKASVRPANPAAGRTDADVQRDIVTCARKPARVFIANRSPASLLVGEVGGTATATGEYNPDQVVVHTEIPLTAGPSRVYLAPVVERDGAYALRVFVVCFDSATVFVIDPASNTLENVIRVGVGPFAMAFDPFSMEDVATHKKVEIDPREPSGQLRRYRFAYLASFTNSFVQIIDLDNAQPNPATYERIVFTLGRPTAPKGS